MKVAVVGLGYVGTVTAACLAANGHDVWGVDVDAAKVDEICAAAARWPSPAWMRSSREAWPAARCTRRRRAPRPSTRPTCRLSASGTPSTARGGTDLSYIRRAVDDIAAALAKLRPPASGQHSVVIRSTVPPGTVEDVVSPALAGGLAGTDLAVGVAMCPEFLREGSGIADFFAPPLIVVGTL